MAELLFITPEQIAQTTILGGNVDFDKYTFCIANAQITVIEPLLGTILYNKIVDDVTNATLTGVYETLYTNFVQPITKNSAVGQYIEIAAYILDNGGLYKHTGDNIEVVDKNETQYVALKYESLSQMYIQRFNKWISLNLLPEYQMWQDEVNAQRVDQNQGWTFNESGHNSKYRNDSGPIR